jgi:hypothetical protein
MGIEADIENILKNDWDPIGVGNDPNAANEYHRYVYELLTLLPKKPSKSDLLKYLTDAEDYMGLNSSSKEQLAIVADNLLKLNFPHKK